ncbi:hypothetical protein AWV79_24950 [Cupriavidus sp. UYMMa02A]|nr:hypothetical protein AWV79_24950 [Cupriavidus sp. UYMMa02A]
MPPIGGMFRSLAQCTQCQTRAALAQRAAADCAIALPAASWAPPAHAALAAGGFAVCHNTADTSVWHSRRSPGQRQQALIAIDHDQPVAGLRPHFQRVQVITLAMHAAAAHGHHDRPRQRNAAVVHIFTQRSRWACARGSRTAARSPGLALSAISLAGETASV